MPQKVDSNLPTSFPNPDYLTLDSSKRGVITLINDSRLPKNALKEARNHYLAEDGQATIRPGVDWFGTEITTTTTTVGVSATAATGTSWTTPTNTTADDASYAVYATTAQNDLILTDFNLTVPTTATILGVTVTVNGNGTNATAANRSIEIGMTKDGTTLAGSRLASQELNQTTDTTLTFGSDSELFSTTLTAAEANETTWGIFLRAGNTNAGARNIDSVTVSLTYENSDPIDGYDYFDANGVVHLIAVAGGYVHQSLNDGQTWTQCTVSGQTTPTLTAGVWTNMNQNGTFLYLSNATDDLIRYDGTTTLQAYTELATPSAPSVAKTGLAATTYSYWYKIAQVNQVGFTDASTAGTITVSATRDGWDASNYVTLTGTVSTSATRVDVYISEDNVNFYYLSSSVVNSGTGAYTLKDDGTAVVIPSTIAPDGNTTRGPKVAELTNIGVRQYGVRDPDYPYRIWFSGAGNNSGAFAGAYDGGYLEYQPGGKLKPIKSVDYRSGKGDPVATIFMDSADSLGGVIQMTLETLTVDTISVTVPSAYLLPGSRGTPAPGSVVNVLNDYFFYNSQAFYNLGSRQQFLNILSTDEMSANIRPNVKAVSRVGESNIASVYYDANILFSVPISSDTNNYTMVYNTEMKAWLPEAFTIGFRKFLCYTDQNKSQHLLALKPGDTRLSEISSGFKGDYGEPFETSLTTGLYPTTKDRFEFQFTEEAEFELANTGGTVSVELLGIDRSKGYSSIKTVLLSASSATVSSGWDYTGWDLVDWDDTSGAPVLASEVSLKRYFPVQKELNAIQWHIQSNSIEASYVMRTLQTWGTPTQAGHPSSWRLKPI